MRRPLLYCAAEIDKVMTCVMVFAGLVTGAGVAIEVVGAAVGASVGAFVVPLADEDADADAEPELVAEPVRRTYQFARLCAILLAQFWF